MKLRHLFLLSFLVAPLMADDLVPLEMRFARVTLSNGRVLTDAALTGYNRDTGLIYVMEDRKLRPYPAALFPTFITNEVDARSAEYPVSPNTPEAPPAPAATEAPAAVTQPPGTPAGDAARAAALEDAIAASAQRAAVRHFRYHQRNGSGYSTLTNADVELDPPTAVPGWPDRYRVEGIVYYSFYDSVGEVFQNRQRGVEVIVQATSSRRVKVIDVNTDWTPAR